MAREVVCVPECRLVRPTTLPRGRAGRRATACAGLGSGGRGAAAGRPRSPLLSRRSTMQRSILGAVAVLALAAAPLSAQDIAGTRAFRLGVKAGASVPVGDLAESGEEGGNASTGFNVGGSLAFAPAALPFGVRVEVGYDR